MMVIIWLSYLSDNPFGCVEISAAAGVLRQQRSQRHKTNLNLPTTVPSYQQRPTTLACRVLQTNSVTKGWEERAAPLRTSAACTIWDVGRRYTFTNSGGRKTQKRGALRNGQCKFDLSGSQNPFYRGVYPSNRPEQQPKSHLAWR